MAVSLNVKDATSSTCDCVGYQDAFSSLHADCSILGDELCTKFIKRIPNEKICMNEMIGKSDMQWCYVSPSCAEGQALQWANPLLSLFLGKSAAKWKKCGATEKSFGQMTVTELAAWCNKNDMDLGLVAQFAYPTWAEDKLPAVWSFWGVHPPAGAPESSFRVAPVSDTLKNKLLAQTASGKPMFFSSPSGHPPFGVSEGKALYYINFGKKIEEQARKGGDFFEHPGIINDIKCIAGCDKVEDAWWSPLDS